MTSDDADVHERIRRVVKVIESFVSSVPEKAVGGSRRAREESDLRRTPDGGGVGRAGLLLDAQQSAALKVTGMTFFARGVADLLEVASGLPGRTANGPSLAVLARSAAEAAALVGWLLDSEIDASERARRTLVYLFDDLKHKLSVSVEDQGTPAAAAPIAAYGSVAVGEIDDLVQRAQRAGWQARPRMKIDGSMSGPGLLREDKEKLEKLPDLSELVANSHVGDPTHYRALSAEAHVARFAVLAGQSEEDRYAGFLVPSYSLLVLAHSLANATSTISEWTGVSNAELLRPLQDLSSVV